MALFQKKITFDDLLKAAAALSDEEKKKLRETLEEKPAEPQEEPAEETESDEHIAQMIEQLTDRVRGLEETLKEFSELKERMTEYDRKNAEKFGYAGAPGKCRRDTLDMSADELRAAILSGER